MGSGIARRAGGAAGAAALVSALASVLAGCTITIGGGGSPAPAAKPTAAPSWRIVPPSHPPREIGPKGLAGLDVGMTLDQAAATGEFTRPATKPSLCNSATGLNGITVGFSPKYGVTKLTAENVHTPEGITAGSTFAEVVRAYPTPSEPDSPYLDDLLMFGDIWAAVPGRPDAEYVFMFGRQGLTRATAGQAKVMYILLKLRAERNC
ncbi:hypothetical protein [Streptomyces sp. NPDC049040]|uniref:hypothetical protein n=1 Tax=Streptomyces sp. NPDC049040 TaxID=3365593 RepID=UPI0037161B15